MGWLKPSTYRARRVAIDRLLSPDAREQEQVLHFDDRLNTVLAQPADDPHDRAVRWRQLVELLARSGRAPATAAIAEAVAVVRADAEALDPGLRAAAARAIAGLELRPELIAAFASDARDVAAPVLAAATLAPEEWRSVHAGASADNRRFLESLHPELAQSVPEARAQPDEAIIPSISEVVARIERLRHARERPNGGLGALQPAAGSTNFSLFRWECTPSGEIGWVDGVPRGGLVGRALTQPGSAPGGDSLSRAFAMRAPFHDAPIRFLDEGAVAGEWAVSGVPAFEPADGRFAGYRGIAIRRPASVAPPANLADPDAIRELVHELKTPLNAIIGFAEIIDGQYLGPAHRPYRAQARDIVSQARLLLAAIDDLDLAAKLRSDPGQGRTSANLHQLLGDVLAELREHAAARDVELTVDEGSDEIRCLIEPALGERLVRRFCTALIDAAEPGEGMRIGFSAGDGQCRIAVSRPRGLDVASGGTIERGDGELGAAFWFHLVRGLAHVAGGDLLVGDEWLTLTIPQH